MGNSSNPAQIVEIVVGNRAVRVENGFAPSEVVVTIGERPGAGGDLPWTIGAVVVVGHHPLIGRARENGHVLPLTQVVVFVVTDLPPLVVGDALQPAVCIPFVGIGDVLIGDCLQFPIGIESRMLGSAVGVDFIGDLAAVIVHVSCQKLFRSRCCVKLLFHQIVVVVIVMQFVSQRVGLVFEPAKQVVLKGCRLLFRVYQFGKLVSAVATARCAAGGAVFKAGLYWKVVFELSGFGDLTVIVIFVLDFSVLGINDGVGVAVSVIGVGSNYWRKTGYGASGRAQAEECIIVVNVCFPYGAGGIGSCYLSWIAAFVVGADGGHDAIR